MMIAMMMIRRNDDEQLRMTIMDGDFSDLKQKHGNNDDHVTHTLQCVSTLTSLKYLSPGHPHPPTHTHTHSHSHSHSHKSMRVRANVCMFPYQCGGPPGSMPTQHQSIQIFYLT
eukprot:scaffold20315_cov20-Tisochrysis_lutea.AAC.1